MGFLAALAQDEGRSSRLAALSGSLPTKSTEAGKPRQLGVKTVSGDARGDAPLITTWALAGSAGVDFSNFRKLQRERVATENP